MQTTDTAPGQRNDQPEPMFGLKINDKLDHDAGALFGVEADMPNDEQPVEASGGSITTEELKAKAPRRDWTVRQDYVLGGWGVWDANHREWFARQVTYNQACQLLEIYLAKPFLPPTGVCATNPEMRKGDRGDKQDIAAEQPKPRRNHMLTYRARRIADFIDEHPDLGDVCGLDSTSYSNGESKVAIHLTGKRVADALLAWFYRLDNAEVSLSVHERSTHVHINGTVNGIHVDTWTGFWSEQAIAALVDQPTVHTLRKLQIASAR